MYRCGKSKGNVEMRIKMRCTVQCFLNSFVAFIYISINRNNKENVMSQETFDVCVLYIVN